MPKLSGNGGDKWWQWLAKSVLVGLGGGGSGRRGFAERRQKWKQSRRGKIHNNDMEGNHFHLQANASLLPQRAPTLHTYSACPRLRSHTPSLSSISQTIIGCRLKLAWNSAAGASFVAKFYWITRACLGSARDLLAWVAFDVTHRQGRGGGARRESGGALDYHACENSLKLFFFFVSSHPANRLCFVAVCRVATRCRAYGGTCNHFSSAPHKPFCAFDSPLTFCQLSLFIRNVFA